MLLLDEPLSALDPFLRVQMRAELRRWQKELGITFIHVTHSQEEAMALADTMVVMNHGRIEQDGRRRGLQPPAQRVRGPLHGRPQRLRGRRGKVAVRTDRTRTAPGHGAARRGRGWRPGAATSSTRARTCC